MQGRAEGPGAYGDILIIAGMHRSGTSFLTSLLQSMGLDVGRDLDGLYENRDFVRFHRGILAARGQDERGYALERGLGIPEAERQRARELLAQAAKPGPWGWKDPRTTLFLDAWAELVPQAWYLFVFRPPWEVADSLYRRDDESFAHDPELPLRVWLNYNRALLEFYERYPERCLLLDIHGLIYSLANEPGFLARALETRLALPLQSPPDPALFRPGQFRSEVSRSHRPELVAYYYPEALQLLQELRRKATQPVGYAPAAEPQPMASLPHRQWAFEDWRHICRLQAEVRRHQPMVTLIKSNPLFRLISRIRCLLPLRLGGRRA